MIHIKVPIGVYNTLQCVCTILRFPYSYIASKIFIPYSYIASKIFMPYIAGGINLRI